MAGRIRSIKPEWLDDERLLECTSDARVISVALLLLSDDAGRGRIGKSVALRVLPKNPEVFDQALGELRPWFVRLYEVRGQVYFKVTNWKKHQRIDRPSRPTTPNPSEGRWIDIPPEANTREPSSSPRRALDADVDLDLEEEMDLDLYQEEEESYSRALVEPSRAHTTFSSVEKEKSPSIGVFDYDPTRAAAERLRLGLSEQGFHRAHAAMRNKCAKQRKSVGGWDSTFAAFLKTQSDSEKRNGNGAQDEASRPRGGEISGVSESVPKGPNSVGAGGDGGSGYGPRTARAVEEARSRLLGKASS